MRTRMDELPVGTEVVATQAYRAAFRGPYVGQIAGKCRRIGYVRVRKEGVKTSIMYPAKFWTRPQGVPAVRATFASMIPEEEWTKLVQREIHTFLHDTTDRYSNRVPSGLGKVVQEELTKHFTERVREELSKPEWTGQWDSGGYKTSEAVGKLLVQYAPEIFARAIGGMFSRPLRT